MLANAGSGKCTCNANLKCTSSQWTDLHTGWLESLTLWWGCCCFLLWERVSETPTQSNLTIFSLIILSWTHSRWSDPHLPLAGVTGEDGLTVAGRNYYITFPCEEDLVCSHMWKLGTSETNDYVAVVSNGEIHTGEAQYEESKCTLQIIDEDVGRHRCRRRPGIFSPRNSEYSQD